MAGDGPDATKGSDPGFDRGKAATEKALAEFRAAGTVSPEARRIKAQRDIGFSLVRLILGAAVGTGLGWLYWTTENRWAFIGAVVLGIGPVIGALMKMYRGIAELKASSTR
ncbi:MAG: hypothetical protein ABIJ86_01360 [Spirochaetota bacterium]